jgi:hypothetical protein
MSRTQEVLEIVALHIAAFAIAFIIGVALLFT